MNINLKEVILTSPDGQQFTRISEIYIKGNTIKYLRIPESVVDKVKENQANPPRKAGYSSQRGGYPKRGGRGGRGGRDKS
jgi:U6 snRNA-associated Sm-like protein LSm4